MWLDHLQAHIGDDLLLILKWRPGALSAFRPGEMGPAAPVVIPINSQGLVEAGQRRTRVCLLPKLKALDQVSRTSTECSSRAVCAAYPHLPIHRALH